MDLPLGAAAGKTCRHSRPGFGRAAAGTNTANTGYSDQRSSSLEPPGPIGRSRFSPSFSVLLGLFRSVQTRAPQSHFFVGLSSCTRAQKNGMIAG
jgi:hypothetical protein